MVQPAIIDASTVMSNPGNLHINGADQQLLDYIDWEASLDGITNGWPNAPDFHDGEI